MICIIPYENLSLSRAPPTGDSGALAGAAPAPRSCPSLAAAASLQREAAAARDGPHNRQPSQPPSSLPRYSTTPPRSTPLWWAGRPWQGGSASPGHGSGLTRWLAASPLLSARLLPVRRPLCPWGRTWDCFWEPQLLPLASGLAGGDGSALPGSRSAPPPRLVATSSPCCGVDAPGLRGAWGWPPGCRAAPAGCRAAG